MDLLHICLVIFAGTSAVIGADECFPATNGTEPMPCVIVEGEQKFTVGAANCSKYEHCCEKYDACYLKYTENNVIPESDEDMKNAFLSDAQPTMDKAKEDKEIAIMKFGRFGAFGPPIGLPGCQPPIPFPANCQPTRNEPYVLVPPTDIPYCSRIPCSAENNAPLEKSHKMCGSQPGCYFDKELFEYREAFGQSVLPGVPVCHLAIRNRVFLQKAQKVIADYGSWNPYFTNCLLNEYHEEINSGPKGCELLPILDAFKVTAKMAGWSTTTPKECALIDGCFRPGRGCFYPVDISAVVVKSGPHHLGFDRHAIVYGRPKCQHFDTSSPMGILKSYHQCLSSGCSVDPSVTSLYYNHLFAIGNDMSVENHWDFWASVSKGQIGAYNIEEMAYSYGYTPKKTATEPEKPTVVPTAGNPFQLPQNPINPVAPPTFQLPSVSPIAHTSHGCGPAFRNYGMRPCAPTTIHIPNYNNYCPYRPFSVPRFPLLKGKFDGCCDINLCYLPKSEISKMHSGPTYYYSEWSLFSSCSATCGIGEKRRYRKCVSQDKSLCTENLMEIHPCEDAPCSSWAQWTAYTPCPNTCYPGGIQTRKRACLPKGGFCKGESEQVKTCNMHGCGFDAHIPPGVWTPWNKEGCVYDRNQGMCEETETRYCMYNGIPGGKCVGTTMKTKKYRCMGCH